VLGSTAVVAGLTGIAGSIDWSSIATLLFMAAGAAAHEPEAEFADWFRSLKKPGTGGAMGGSVSCCSPERGCQRTGYETDGDGRYCITVEGE
jgi:hypothetical protein